MSDKITIIENGTENGKRFFLKPKLINVIHPVFLVILDCRFIKNNQKQTI